MADNEWDKIPDFNPADVSSPIEPRRESEIIAEQRAAYRREWIRSHIFHIFSVVGVIAVALVFVIIHLYNQSSNPIGKLVSASAKDFGVPFEFRVTVSEDDNAVMTYSGSIDIDSRKHSIRAAYDADYNDYAYKGIVFADRDRSVKGFYYKDKWTVRDCNEQISNFFDFDSDYRAGKFDAGSFLRFTGLTDRYSAEELGSFVSVLKDRLSSDGNLASLTVTKSGSNTEYSYNIDMNAFFELIKAEGASVFLNAEDYNAFAERVGAGSGNIKSTKCVMTYTIDNSGYLTAFILNISAPAHSFSVSCEMSGFNMTVTPIPAEFLELATDNPTEP